MTKTLGTKAGNLLLHRGYSSKFIMTILK